jgi:hypothetical protein
MAGTYYVTVNSSIPPGAAALGYTKLVVDNQPVVSQISPYPTYNGNYDWFSGLWFDQENNSYYSESNGVLAMTLGGTLSGTPLDFSTGALPGANGFYVEFVYWLTVVWRVVVVVEVVAAGTDSSLRLSMTFRSLS